MTEIQPPAASAPQRGLRAPLGPRGWLLLALAIVVAGGALSWGWLTAIGIAPLLLAVAPCALMCAFGLCMRGGGATCSDQDALAKTGPEPGED